MEISSDHVHGGAHVILMIVWGIGATVGGAPMLLNVRGVRDRSISDTVESSSIVTGHVNGTPSKRILNDESPGPAITPVT